MTPIDGPDKLATPLSSPYIAGDWMDYTASNRIKLVITFDDVTRALIALDTHRDEACMYHSIAVGIGPDGTPDTSPIRWTPPVGDYTSTAQDLAWLASVGVTTIEEFNNHQITAVV